MEHRNAYLWMASPRKPGYVQPTEIAYGTQFDAWLHHMGWSCREAALALDIPEQRTRDLRAGWRQARINGGMLPSIMTRLAMSACAAGIPPAKETPDCYDLRDRLAQAASDAGLDPWPAGEMPKEQPRSPNKWPPACETKKAATKLPKEHDGRPVLRRKPGKKRLRPAA